MLLLNLFAKSGYSKKFFEEHRQEITIHKAAKQAFDELQITKLPSLQSLYEEFHQLAVQKKQDYAEYRQIRKEKEELLILLFAVLYLIAILMGVVFYLLPENKTVIVTSDEISVYCRKHPDVYIAWNPDIYVGAHLFKENASPMLDSDSYEVVISNVHWMASAELSKRQSYPYAAFDPNGQWVISCGRCSKKKSELLAKQINQLRNC